MNKKYQILAICGKSGAGKDSIMNAMVEAHPHLFHKIISCTTRPKRENETEGKDYYFIEPNDFLNKVYTGEMLEATNFNNWYYGTPITALNSKKINIGIFNLDGIDIIQDDPRVEVKVIEIIADDKVRLMRQLTREEYPNCAEICRRYGTDEKDWEKYKGIIIPNIQVDNSMDTNELDIVNTLSSPKLDVLLETMWEDADTLVSYRSIRNTEKTLDENR